MNSSGFIDYRKPTRKQNDYRTSTYRGHVYMTEELPIKNAGNLINVCTKFPRDINKEEILKSEVQDLYDWKSTDPTFIRNPTVNRTQFIKPYEESKLKFCIKPLQLTTSFNRDYQIKPVSHAEMPSALNMLSPVEPVKGVLVVRGKPGYSKFLEPSSTTNKLQFVEYITPSLNLACKDNITYWNWKKEKKNVFKIKQTVCDKLSSSQCPKRREEFTSQVKCVPNRGLTSESKSNYNSAQKYINFDVTHITNKLLSVSQVPMLSDSENNIYGSGKPVHKYVG